MVLAFSTIPNGVIHIQRAICLDVRCALPNRKGLCCVHVASVNENCFPLLTTAPWKLKGDVPGLMEDLAHAHAALKRYKEADALFKVQAKERERVCVGARDVHHTASSHTTLTHMPERA